MYDFKDLHVVVTGGTGALGTAVVGALLEAGAAVHIPAVDAAEVARFRFAGQARLAEGVDLTDETAVETFYSRFAKDPEDGPRLWASIHIAGGFAMAPFEQTSKSDFLHQVHMNLLTCFLCCREAVRSFKAGSGGGRLVNVAARPGVMPELGAGMVGYTVSKAGIVALTQSLAAEVAGDGILVNAVAPSIMDTPANRASMPKADHGKWPRVEEVAATILFLASPENRVTRGGIVPVYGRS
jgi:NAD(P)-dependent dehydrogenase (short-subunit alcohol dehydrogenase family)